MTGAPADRDQLLGYCRRRTEHARRILAGLSSSDSVQAILDDYRPLFGPERVQVALVGAADGAEADRRRRRALVLVDGAMALRTAAQLDALDAWERHPAIGAAGAELCPRDVVALLRRGADQLSGAQRDRLAAAYEQSVALSAGVRKDLWAGRSLAAQELGHGTYAELYSMLLSVDLRGIGTVADTILRDTEETYRAGLAAHCADALGHSPGPGPCLSWFHVPQLMAGHQWDRVFARKPVDSEIQRLLEWSAGDKPRRAGILVDLGDRPGKSSRPFCAAVQVPGEIHLVARPHGAHRDWEELYHELGHVVHFANAPPSLPWEFRHLPWDAVAETHAFWMASLLRDPEYLAMHFFVNEDDAHRYAAFATFLELLMVRAYCARLLQEIAFHADGPASLTSYPSRMMQAVAVRYPATWAMLEMEGGLAAARYLQAWVLWGELQHVLGAGGTPADTEAGERLGLVRSLWRSCATDTPASLMARLGAARSDPSRLVDALTTSPGKTPRTETAAPGGAPESGL